MIHIVTFIFDGAHVHELRFQDDPDDEDAPPVDDLAEEIAVALDRHALFDEVRVLRPAWEVSFGTPLPEGWNI